MKFLEIAKAAGSTALVAAFPTLGPLALATINKFLSEEDKLPENATGQEAISRFQGLPLYDQAEIARLEFQYEEKRLEESHATLRTMLEYEGNNQHSTRPKIAYLCFWALGIISCSIALAIAYGIVKNTVQVENAALAFLALSAPFAVILKAYFGILEMERRSMHALANGETLKEKPSILGGLLSKH